ncbi:DNA-protecting protein DprA, partial [Rickettsiaceae bacterium]|nr:DNA-protecting protein DprA [Rickettsiaceae bacterium]
FALDQNREVFSVPGFPLDPRCMGSNKLIKDGAYLLESAADVISNVSSFKKLKKSLEESETSANNFNIPTDDSNLDVSDKDRQLVINLLSSTPITYEALVDETNFSLPVIYTICLELELAGKITRYPGGRIALIY